MYAISAALCLSITAPVSMYVLRQRFLYVRLGLPPGARSEVGMSPTACAFAGLFVWLSVFGLVGTFQGVWMTNLGHPDGPYIAAFGVVYLIPLSLLLGVGRYVRLTFNPTPTHPSTHPSTSTSTMSRVTRPPAVLDTCAKLPTDTQLHLFPLQRATEQRQN